MSVGPLVCNVFYTIDMDVKVYISVDVNADVEVADCPAMSFVLFGDIAGSGDPLYVAELCNWHYYGQRRSIRLIFFWQKRHFVYKLSVKKQTSI